jgi:putative FmdB family regulatory protein
MPTYGYICGKCSHEFEKVQSIKDAALKVCPKELCAQKKWGKGRVKRAIGAGAGLIFKGSGFYITDYRSENYKAGAKKDSAPAASSSDSKSTAPAKSSETKSAPAKSESKPAKPAKSDG